MTNFSDYPGDFRIQYGHWEILSKIGSLPDYLGELAALKFVKVQQVESKQ